MQRVTRGGVVLLCMWGLLVGCGATASTPATTPAIRVLPDYPTLTPISADSTGSAQPSVSTNASATITVADRDSFAVADPDSGLIAYVKGQKMLLADRAAFGGLRWSPDGTRLLAIRADAVQDVGFQGGVWVYDLAQGGKGRLVAPDSAAGQTIIQAVWSPDSARIAFVVETRTQDMNTPTPLPVYATSTAIIATMTAHAPTSAATAPPVDTPTALPANPLQGLFPDPRGDPNAPRYSVSRTLWLVDVAGGAPRKLADGDSPAFLPGTDRILYIAPDPNGTVMSLDPAAATAQPTPLATNITRNMLPLHRVTGETIAPALVALAPSPDGRIIAFGGNLGFLGYFAADAPTPVLLSELHSESTFGTLAWASDSATFAADFDCAGCVERVGLFARVGSHLAPIPTDADLIPPGIPGTFIGWRGSALTILEQPPSSYSAARTLALYTASGSRSRDIATLPIAGRAVSFATAP